MDLQINEKFEKLIPELPMEQYAVLKDDIKEYGIRDPLLVWNGVIIDGHNRYRIAQELGITDIPTKDITFADDDEAAIYIVKNQSMRRNLNMAMRLRYAFMLEPQLKKLAKEKQAGKVGAKVDVLADIGKIAGVGKDTVSKYRFIYDKADAKQLDALENGELKITQLWKLLQPKKETEPVKLPTPPTDLIGILLQKLDKNEKVEKATITALKDEKGKWDIHWRLQEKREKKEREVTNRSQWNMLWRMCTLPKTPLIRVSANGDQLTCSFISQDKIQLGNITYPNFLNIKDGIYGVEVQNIKKIVGPLKGNIELKVIRKGDQDRFIMSDKNKTEVEVGIWSASSVPIPPSDFKDPDIIVTLTNNEVKTILKYKSSFGVNKRYMAFMKKDDQYILGFDISESGEETFWKTNLISKLEIKLSSVDVYTDLINPIGFFANRLIPLLRLGETKIGVYNTGIVKVTTKKNDIEGTYYIKGTEI